MIYFYICLVVLDIVPIVYLSVRNIELKRRISELEDMNNSLSEALDD